MAVRDLSGRTLHHYRVLEKLGQGGMGEVWMAEDLHLERRIALKLLPASDALDSDRLLRFEREAKAVAALDHPNIVTLHSIETLAADDPVADGTPIRFLTMELLAGERLDHVIPDQGMDLATFLGLAIPIADAVAAAHTRGVTHRDLKPSNVVLTADGRPKVLDFGLAKLRDGRDGTDDEGDGDGAAAEVPRDPLLHTLTRTATHVAQVEGTLPYMSPEQLTGEDVGRPSDVFSLGVLLHEMLTGSRPFEASHLVTLMAAILRDEPPSLAAARPDLPAELVAVVEKCLAKKPEARYADAGALRDALQHVKDLWLSGSSTAIAAPPRAYDRRAGLAVAGVLLAAVLALAAFLGRQQTAPYVDPAAAAERAEASTRIAVLPFENLGNEDDRYFAQGVAEEIRSRLAAVGGLSVISRSAVARFVAEGLSRAEIAAQLDVGYLLEGTVRWDRSGVVDRVRVTPQLVRISDDTQVWSSTYDRNLADIFSVQTEIAEEVIGNLGVALFPAERQAVGAGRPTSSLPAYQAYLRGREFQADSIYDRTAYEHAIHELDTAVALDPRFAAAHAALSQTHSMMYHLGYDRTPEREERALRALDEALALAPDDPEVRMARGYYHYRIEKDYDAALDDFRAVVGQLPSASDGFEAMAYVLRRQGKLDEAARMLERSLELSPGTSRLILEVATTRLFLRQYEAARDLYEDTLIQSPGDPNVYRALALTHWLASGDLPAARLALESMPSNDDPVNSWYWFHQNLFEGDFEAALAAVSQPIDDDGGGGGMIQWTFFAYPPELLQAQALDLLLRDGQAREAYTAAEERLRRQLVTSPLDSRLHSALGLALAGLGRDDEAFAAARRGVELLPVTLDAGTGPYRLFELALVQTRAGDLEGALATLYKLLSIPARVSKTLIELDPRFADVVARPEFAEVPTG